MILHILMVQGAPRLAKTSSIAKPNIAFCEKSEFHGNQKWDHSVRAILEILESCFSKMEIR